MNWRYPATFFAGVAVTLFVEWWLLGLPLDWLGLWS